ncbi:MAG: DegT/DnrJ/EryC1/StrS family aminotransferase [Turneriella sp.]|nr:DegT/DnrJ/EryC1/StrS family aminotransferase [Turneriella sp.]
MVPLLDLTRENKPLLDEIKAAMEPLLVGSQFILGKAVDDFEAAASSYFGVKPEQALAVSSGTDAQLLALMAGEFKTGSECVTSPFTFFATAGVIHRAGMRTVFADIDPRTFNIDPVKAAEAVTPKTTALMPVHLYGQACDMDPLIALAKDKNLLLIEDAAQAMGAKHKGRPVATMGDMGEVSFFPTKNLGAFGDAGMLIVKNEKYVEKARRIRVHGMKNRYEHLEVGGNFRIDAIQAAILQVKLKHLNSWHEMRRANAALYRELFGKLNLGEKIILPYEDPNCYHIYNQFIIRVTNGKRDALKKHLDEKQIGNMIYYPTPLHLQPCFAYLGYKKGDFPHSEKACEEVLALPIHSHITQDEIAQVVEAIGVFFK